MYIRWIDVSKLLVLAINNAGQEIAILPNKYAKTLILIKQPIAINLALYAVLILPIGVMESNAYVIMTVLILNATIWCAGRSLMEKVHVKFGQINAIATKIITDVLDQIEAAIFNVQAEIAINQIHILMALVFNWV